MKELIKKQEKEFDKEFNNQFCFDCNCGSYMYHLTRTKEAFDVETMTFDDFVEMKEGGEWEEETRKRFKNFISKVRQETTEYVENKEARKRRNLAGKYISLERKLKVKLRNIKKETAKEILEIIEKQGVEICQGELPRAIYGLLIDFKKIKKQILKELK